jgi:hypothetical protein
MNKVIVASLAALLAGSTTVFAQQDGDRGNAGGNSPAAGARDGASPSARDQAPGQMKEPGSARDKVPDQAKDPGASARDDAPGKNKDAADKSKEDRTDRSDKTEKKDDNEGRKAQSGDSDDKDSRRDGEKADRADGKEKADRADGKEKADSADEKNGDTKAKAAGRDVSPEQKTKVKTVFKNHRVEPARNINFSLNVGVSVPRDVRFYAMPQDIILIVPQYEDYRYFLVDDKIIIVDPNTYEIVDVITIA